MALQGLCKVRMWPRAKMMAFPSYPGDVRQKLSFQNCRQNRYLHAHLCSSLKVSYSSWKWHTRTVILNQEQGSKSSCYLLVIIGKGTFPKGLKNYYESSLSPAMGTWSIHCRIKKKKKGGVGWGVESVLFAGLPIFWANCRCSFSLCGSSVQRRNYRVEST